LKIILLVITIGAEGNIETSTKEDRYPSLGPISSALMNPNEARTTFEGERHS
jgi:hypothetical protein